MYKSGIYKVVNTYLHFTSIWLTLCADDMFSILILSAIHGVFVCDSGS